MRRNQHGSWRGPRRASAATGSVARSFPTWVALGAAVVTAVSLGVLPAAAAPPAPPPPPPGPSAAPFLPPPLAALLADRAQKAKERFDRKGRAAPDKVTAWGVDEATGKMVVEVVGGRTPETDRFTADSDPAMVDVDENSPKVRRFADLVGGRAIFAPNGARCSVGVSARTLDGRAVVLTAGHCTETPGNWSGSTTASTSGPRAVIGPVGATAFPGDDFGAIIVTNTGTWRPTGLVQGGPRIRGSVEAALRASVCRSGSTTGYRCGAIQAKNQSVNYGGGDVVYGLTRTGACAEPGDSGGTFVTPAGQAQGLLSGGTGDCRSGGVTYFQPVNEALQRYRLRLVTG